MWEVDSTCTESFTIKAGIVHQSLKLWVMRLLRRTTAEARERVLGLCGDGLMAFSNLSDEDACSWQLRRSRRLASVSAV
jgi:hypothetical protein